MSRTLPSIIRPPTRFEAERFRDEVIALEEYTQVIGWGHPLDRRMILFLMRSSKVL
jgi:hypothetical protein